MSKNQPIYACLRLAMLVHTHSVSIHDIEMPATDTLT
jgi:hypothetical protein